MSCTTTNTAKPDVVQRPVNIYGAPQGQAGRVFDSIDYGIQGIILHCTDMTISQYVSYLACLTQPVLNISKETDHHYSIGSAGALNQHIDDGNISWTFGNYNSASYVTPPSPTRTVEWPVLQTENGTNVSPDVYVINILIAKSYNQGTACLTSSGLPADQHDKLLQLIAYLSGAYNIPIDADHINWHDNIATQACPSTECACTDIACLISDLNSYCDDDCTNLTYSEVSCGAISHLLAIPDNCGNVSGCLVSVPFDACCLGSLPQVGDIEQFVGVQLIDDEYCLVKNTLSVTPPITGEGTTDSPLALDLCSFGEFVPDGTPVSLLGIDAEGCLVETVLSEVIAGAETPLTVTDTPSVDLTASGTNGHELTAAVKISATAGNLLSENADGLFVDFGCDDLDNLFDSGIVDAIYGVDGDENCVFEDATSLIEATICKIDIDDGTGTPMHFLGRDIDLECPVFFTVAQLVAAGITVLNTPSVDLTLDGSNVLSANVILDPATDNVAQITANGLYVPQLTINTTDDCISAEIVNGQLNIGLNINSSGLNILSCTTEGLYVQDLVVIDTDCIELTYNSITRELSAELSFAGTVGGVQNAVTCEAGEGLFVPRGANLLANGPLVGIGTGDNPLDIDFSLMDNEDLCDLGGVIPDGLGTALEDVIGRDGNGCLRRVTGEEFIGAFLEVLDTNSVDLTLAGNILSADVNISPAIGGIPNTLVETVNGLYVPVGAGITPVDTNCMAIQLVNGVLTVTPIFDPDSDNQITCTANGLFSPRGAGITGDVTDCISVVANDGVVTATPIISGSILGVANILSCEPGGLFVPEGAGLTVASGNCITLDLTDGVITAEAIVSNLTDNQIVCDASGLYVPQGAGLVGVDTDCMDVTVSNGEIEIEPIIDPDANNLLSCGASGLIVEFAVADSLCIDLTLTSGILTADVIVDPAASNLLTCGANGLLVEFTAAIGSVEDTDCIALDLTGDVLTATPILAPDQGGLTNVLTCIDDGLYVPVGAGLTTLDGNCIDLTLVNGVLTAEAIVDVVQTDNQVSCGSNGLYVPPGAGLQVLDTDCVNLDITPGGVLSATIPLAGTQGGVGNVAQCIPGQGLYVPQGAGLVGVDTNCMDITIQPNGVITVDPIISPDAGNAFECRGNGMFVQQITVDDTNSVDLSINNGVITANLIVDPDPNNALVVSPTGVFVPEAFITAILDTDCIDLDVTGGVLSASPIISPLADNGLVCQGDGLYVPPLVAVDTNCIDLDITSGVLTANPIISAATGNQFDCLNDGMFVPKAAGLEVLDTDCIDLEIVDGVLTANPIISTQFGDNQLTCESDGLYVPQPFITDILDTQCLDLTVTNGVLSIEPIISPLADNLLVCQGDGLYVPPLTAVDSNCIDVDITSGVLTINPILSLTVDNALDCLGDGLYVPKGANVEGGTTDCMVVTATNGVVTVDPVIDPDLTNQLQCTPTGLFVPQPLVTAVDDTQCISLSVTSGVLTATPIIDPAADNGIICGLDGLYVQPITVVDTNCIDLDLTSNVLTANPILSATVDNQLDCLGDGLYVPKGAGLEVLDTDCIDFDIVDGVISAQPIISANLDNIITCEADGLYVPEAFITAVDNTTCMSLSVTNGVLIAQPIVDPALDNRLFCQGTGLYVAPLVGVDTNCIDIDITNNVLTINPIISATVDNQFQCLGDGMYVPKGAGLEVLDSNCFDFTITDGVLTGTPIISGNLDNILTCEADGLYVPEAFVTAVADTNCMSPTVTAGVLTIDPIVSPLVDNLLTCQGDGLYVPPMAVVDTDCINLTFDGTTLTAEIIVDPAADNTLVCQGTGLYVPELQVVDTTCIDLTIAGNVLSADVIVSPLADNLIVCQGDGLYVPAMTVVDTNCIDLDLTANVLTANPIISATVDNQFQCLADGMYVEKGAGLEALDTNCIDITIVDGVISAVPIISATANNIITCEADGLYVPDDFIQAIDDTNCISLSETNGVLTANPILSATADNQLQCIGDGLYVPQGGGLVGLDTDCLSATVVDGEISVNPIIAGTQGGVANSLVCVAGEGLYVPAGADLIVIDGECIDLTITNGNILQAEIIIDPAADNLVTCNLGAGLYVAPMIPINTNCIEIDITSNILTINPIIAPDQLRTNILECLADGLYVPETNFFQNVGASAAGGNIIEVDTDGDGVVDFEFCEGICEIVSANDCVDGGVGAEYALREFDITGTTLTINSAPEHDTVTGSVEEVVATGAGTGHPPGPGVADRVIHEITDLTIVNPNLCRDMLVTFTAEATFNAQDVDPGSSFTVELWIRDTGLVFINLVLGRTAVVPTTDALPNLGTVALTISHDVLIPAGGSFTLTSELRTTYASPATGFISSGYVTGIRAVGSTV